MRDKFQRFMQGRYGADQLSRFLTGVGLVLLIVNLFVRTQFLFYLVLALLIYCYYRMFSRDYASRSAENQKYLRMCGRFQSKLSGKRSELEQRKIYHIYKCPSCGQKIRVPKGKGKIVVTCPKCRTEFQKKS